jgi:DNA-binding MarR family transcriptional regulator
MNTLEKFLSIRSFVNSVERRGFVYGASFSEFVILRAIDQEQRAGIRRIDLAEKVGLSVSGVTRALAPLEKLGYIQRQDQTLDARVRRVVLSDSGRELFKELSQDVDSRMEQSEIALQELLKDISK